MKKYIGLFAFIGMLFVSAAMVVSSNVEVKDTVAFASVEVGYTELSPNGEAGGYAIPASHCSGGGGEHTWRLVGGGDGGIYELVNGPCPVEEPQPECPPGTSRVGGEDGGCWPDEVPGEPGPEECPYGRAAGGNCNPPPFCVQYPNDPLCTGTPPDPCDVNPNAPGCACPNGEQRGQDGQCRPICTGGIFDPSSCGGDCKNGQVEQPDGSCKCPPGQSCKPPISPPGGVGVSTAGVCRSSNNQPTIEVSWDPNVGGYYEVHRCTGSSCTPNTMVTSVYISQFDLDPYTYTNTAVTEGSTYRYRVRFKQLSFLPYSPWSNIATQTAPTCGPQNNIDVDLEVKRDNTSTDSLDPWSDDNIDNLGLTEEIQLRWTSQNAVSCQGTRFETNGATNGTQNSVTEPAAGDTTRYTVICQNSTGQSASDSIDVTRIDGEGDGPSITADPGSVDSGDDADVVWNVGENDPAACTLTADNGGTGLPDSYAAALAAPNGTDTVTITETTTFTITCPNGSASAIIRAIPKIFES